MSFSNYTSRYPLKQRSQTVKDEITIIAKHRVKPYKQNVVGGVIILITSGQFSNNHLSDAFESFKTEALSLIDIPNISLN